MRRFAPLLVLLLATGVLAEDKRLKEAVERRDLAAVETLTDELVAKGGKDSALAILEVIPRSSDALYWHLVRAVATFRDSAAHDELGRWIVAHQNDPRAVAADVLFALGANDAPTLAKPYAFVLEKGKRELKLTAADHLALIRSAEAIAALEAARKREKDPEVARRIESALAAATSETSAKPRDREFARSVERATPAGVIVLSADRTGAPDDVRDNDFDKIQTILERQKIPHTIVKKFEFEKDPAKYLEGCRALLVNCNRLTPYCACVKCNERPEGEMKDRLGPGCNLACKVHTVVCYKLGERALAAVKKWVEEKGGYLYTEDWGILDVVAPIWTDKVAAGVKVRVRNPENTAFLKSVDVRLAPVRGSAGHPLMRGIWQRAAAGEKPDGEGTTERAPPRLLEHRWQIDDESPAIEVKDAQGVTVLLASEELAKLTEGKSAVAITFRPGEQAPPPGKGTTSAKKSKAGRVLHTISHFGHQSTTEDGRALENLIVNFLLEAVPEKK